MNATGWRCPVPGCHERGAGYGSDLAAAHARRRHNEPGDRDICDHCGEWAEYTTKGYWEHSAEQAAGFALFHEPEVSFR